MADETVINGDFSDDGSVEITGEALPKLNQKVSDLEQENRKIIRENKDCKQKIEKFEASIKELLGENFDLKRQVSEAQSENKALKVVAAELETEVSRLQSDLQEAGVELSDLERGLEVREKEMNARLEVFGIEKGLLVAKVEKLAQAESCLRDELELKEKEFQCLKKNVEEMEVVVGNSKSWEDLKNKLERTIEKMKAQITSLKSSLVEKEKVILGFETKGRVIVDAVNGDINGDAAMVEDGTKGLIGYLKKMDWVVLGGSSVAAVSVMGVACYINASRKH